MIKHERTYYFDYLRFYAAIAVALSHVADEFVYANWDQQTISFLSSFNIGNFFDSISRFAVNIFFFTSGALLLDENRSFSLKKQWFKVFKPLVVASIVYAVLVHLFVAWGVPVRIQKVDSLLQMTTITSIDDLFKTIFAYFMQVPLVFHLWFLYRLLSSYLAIPFFRIVTGIDDEVKKKKIIEYALTAWLISSIMIPTINHFNSDLFSRVRADFMPSYLGLILLGYYLHKYPINIKPLYLVLTWAASLSFMVIAIYYEFTNIADKTPKVWPFDNVYIYVIANAVSIFLLAKRFLNRPGKGYRLIEKFSQVSFEFYLCHIMVLSFVFHLWPSWDFFLDHALLTIPFTTFITVVVSYYVAKFIALIKKQLSRQKK